MKKIKTITKVFWKERSCETYCYYDRERVRKIVSSRNTLSLSLLSENVFIMLCWILNKKKTVRKIPMAPFKIVVRLLIFKERINPGNLSSNSCKINRFWFFFHVPKFKNKTGYIFSTTVMKIWETVRMPSLFPFPNNIRFLTV